MLVIVSVHPVGGLTDTGLVAKKSSKGEGCQEYQKVPMLAVLELEFDRSIV